MTDGSKAELKEQSNEEGTVTYAGNTGSMIEYKTDTGYIQYSSKSLLEGSSSEPITRKKADSYYRKKAVEIAKMIGCKQNFDTVKTEVKVSEYMESVDNNGNIVREPVKFRVDYLQKEINNYADNTGKYDGRFYSAEAVVAKILRKYESGDGAGSYKQFSGISSGKREYRLGDLVANIKSTTSNDISTPYTYYDISRTTANGIIEYWWKG